MRDVYQGVSPLYLWSGRSSDVGGLAPKGSDGKLWTNSWESVKCSLDLYGIPQKITGKRIIELGSGQREYFRDYCVQHGAEEYIGVDPAAREVQQLIQGTRVRYKETDAIQFLRDEPANSAMIASFMLLCDEMLNEDECERNGIQPKVIWRELLAQLYRVNYEGQPSICFGSLSQESSILYPLIEEVGFVRTDCAMLLQKPRLPV